jgi:cell division protease FtsH
MNLRNLAIWAFIAVVLVALYSILSTSGKPATNEVSYSYLLHQVDQNHVKSAVIKGDTVEAKVGDNQTLTAVTPANQDDLIKELDKAGADIQVKPANGITLVGVLIQILPLLLLAGAWIFIMRQMQGGARGAMGFGKSKARLLTENKNRVTFDDVAAGRPSRHRQDPAGPRRRGRGGRALLHHLRVGLCRNVCRRRRQSRPRHVRAGEEERALHHLHR